MAKPELNPGMFRIAVVVAATLGYALSARALLFLSILGSFALAWKTLDDPTVLRLVLLGTFLIGVVVPVTILEIRKRT